MGLILFTLLVLCHGVFYIAWKQDRFCVIDVAWGLGFVVVAILGYLQNYPSPPKLLLLLMVAAWGFRLAWHLHTRSRGHGEDPRYQALRDGWGERYLQEGYKRVFLAQAGALFVVSLPVQLGMSSDLERFGAKQALGFLLWAAGLGLEAWSDWHLARFKNDPANRGKLCTDGPWTYVRFPNYLGEMLVWWGVYVYIFNFWTAWTIVGPLAISYFLIKVTGIPPIEQRYRDRADYQAYAARTPRLVPFRRPKVLA